MFFLEKIKKSILYTFSKCKDIKRKLFDLYIKYYKAVLLKVFEQAEKLSRTSETYKEVKSNLDEIISLISIFSRIKKPQLLRETACTLLGKPYQRKSQKNRYLLKN